MASTNQPFKYRASVSARTAPCICRPHYRARFSWRCFLTTEATLRSCPAIFDGLCAVLGDEGAQTADVAPGLDQLPGGFVEQIVNGPPLRLCLFGQQRQHVGLQSGIVFVVDAAGFMMPTNKPVFRISTSRKTIKKPSPVCAGEGV